MQTSAKRGFFAALVAFAAAGCGSSAPNRPPPAWTDGRSLSTRWEQIGVASYYASSLAGKRTASGERYDPSLLTAAHRQLPFGTLVEVRRRDGKRSVIVRINDRGPYAGNRVIDLSYRAAQALGMVRAGKTVVELRPYAPGHATPPRH
jgi:rare lipoprotein A